MRLTPRAGFALCSRAPGGGQRQTGGGRALPLRASGPPRPGFSSPDTACCLGLAGQPEGFSGSVSACHSLQPPLCAPQGSSSASSPLSLQQSSCPGVGTCRPGLGLLVLCGLGCDQRAGSLHLGVGALGPGAVFPTGFTCPVWPGAFGFAPTWGKVPPGPRLPPSCSRTLWVSPGVCTATADPPHVG